MKYDFETLPDRHNTGSSKYEAMLAAKPDAAKGAVPLSVADMEFKNAPEITEGLQKFLETAVLGYTSPTEAYIKAVQGWMQKRHGFTPEKDWFVTTPGIVPALYRIVAAYSEPGDKVIMMSPVYHPFRFSAERQGREAVFCPLIEREKTYDIDFGLFEKMTADEAVKIFLLCSPHNPVGRIWTKEEIVRLSEICLKNNVLFVADEIHADLIMPGYAHVSAGTLGREHLKNMIICTAPTKTFNIAGMQVSNLFIPDAEKRDSFDKNKEYGHLGIMSYEACRLAYTGGEAWLEELLSVLDGNRKMVEDFCREELPQVKPFELMGTYLMWLDCRSLGLSKEELEARMVKHDLFFDEGYIFGEEGAGFERINLACPAWVIKESLARLKAAVLE